jgi:lysophospholipase L1-like esterase
MKRVAGLVVLALTLSACAGKHATSSSGASNTNAPGITVLTIGDSATEGDGIADRLRGAWPYLLLNEALSPKDQLVNGALDGATAANALAEQAPLAAQVHANDVAIWIGAEDVVASTPVATFQSNYQSLVQEVQAAGARRVLLADLPLSFGRQTAQIDDAIRSVARSTNAQLVELGSATVPRVLADGSGPSLVPNEQGQRVVADAFERALRTGG